MWSPLRPTEHVSLLAKSVSGSSVKVVGPPVTVAVCAPLVRHTIRNQDPMTSTGSLNVTVMLLPTGIPAAPAAGVRAVRVGGSSPVQAWRAEDLLRGVGPPLVTKSKEFESVSVQPSDRRSAAVVLSKAPA